VNALVMNDTNIFAGTYGGGVFLSTNSGKTWSAVNSGLTNYFIYSLLFKGNDLFASTDEGIFLSSNNGANWKEINSGLTNHYVLALAVSGKNLFAGTDGGVFVSTNNGTNWMAVNDGLTFCSVRALAVSGSYVFAGTFYGGVYRRPLLEMITSVENPAADSPTYFKLEQNYPNPFNPSSQIDYNIPQTSFVLLKVYDILGREVTQLVNEVKQPGSYSIRFDGANLPSGIYFYSLITKNFQQVRKMVMVK
jgi:photosystem II stability/assembly factor-like uncharacterized protein